MPLLRLLSFLFIFYSSNTIAAGSGEHHASVADLIWPAINVGTLFLCLFILLKRPVRMMFEANAERVQELYDLAEEMDKDQKIKIDTFEKKLQTVSDDVRNIMNEMNEFASKYYKEANELLEVKIEKLHSDARVKLEHEKNIMLSRINEKLADEVIAKTKSEINQDIDLRNKATNKLLEGLN